MARAATPGHYIDAGTYAASFRSRRSWGTDLFLFAWLLGWAYGVVFAVSALTSDDVDAAGVAFLLVWLTAWLAGGGFAMCALAYDLAGRQIVVVTPVDVAVETRVGPIARTKRYRASTIRDVRTVRLRDGERAAFSYDRDTVVLGDGRGDAQALVAAIAARTTPTPAEIPASSRENFRVGAGFLEVRHGRRWRRYERETIVRLRAEPNAADDEGTPSISSFSIAFDYGTKTVRFAGPLMHDEAEALARELRGALLLDRRWARADGAQRGEVADPR